VASLVVAGRPAAPALPEPYARPPSPAALAPAPATTALVRDQVRALLLGSRSYHRLPPPARVKLAHDIVKVAAYAAECVRDDWYQSERKLGQRPLVVRSQGLATVQADQRPGGNFKPGAADKIGSVTKQTLDAIAFPTFVSELISGTFNAITNASIKQMEAYSKLLGDVGRTVDDFMTQNISDNQARDWLVQSYPMFLRVETSGGGSQPPRASKSKTSKTRTPARGSGEPAQARLVASDDADTKKLPDWAGDLGVPGKASLDEDWLESKLLPAARRKLAQTRLQVLSTIVLMGMNRITVTGGKLRATMAFHIDTSDAAREERATDLDFRLAAQGGVNFGFWHASMQTSVAYVSSTRNTADSEMNVAADLTSEVEIHFRSDPFPLERMAGSAALGRIAANTPVPSAAAPVASTGDTIAWGPNVERAAVPKRERPASGVRPIGAPLPPAAEPAEPGPAKGVPDETPPGSKGKDGAAKPESADRAATPEGEDGASGAGTPEVTDAPAADDGASKPADTAEPVAKPATAKATPAARKGAPR
jgi:hypothetical protein